MVWVEGNDGALDLHHLPGYSWDLTYTSYVSVHSRARRA